MKISPLLAALGGGAVGLGLSQGGLGGAGMALSPMLALLLQGKNKGKGPAQSTPTGPEQGAPVPGNTGIAPPQPQPQAPAAPGHKDPKLEAMFQALAVQSGGPFGNAALAPYGYRRY